MIFDGPGAAYCREICTLQRVVRRNYSLIIRAYRERGTRERISSLPRANTRAAALEFTVRRDDEGSNGAWCIIHCIGRIISRNMHGIFIPFWRTRATDTGVCTDRRDRSAVPLSMNDYDVFVIREVLRMRIIYIAINNENYA